jgi:hypothetical protein
MTLSSRAGRECVEAAYAGVIDPPVRFQAMFSSPEIWRNASVSPKEIPQAPVYAPNFASPSFYEVRALVHAQVLLVSKSARYPIGPVLCAIHPSAWNGPSRKFLSKNNTKTGP